MTDEELEAIRPAHVSMDAMRLWQTVRRLVKVCAVVFVAVCVAAYWLPWPLLAILAAAAVLVLSFMVWIGVVAFGFAQYTLRTLLMGVFITGGLLAVCTMLDEMEMRAQAWVYFGLWIFVVCLIVLDYDPLHKVKREERRRKAAAKKEPKTKL